MEKDHFTLVRTYFPQKNSSNLRKVIVYVKNFRGQIVNELAFIQYIFTGSPHAINPQKHRNATSATHSYCRTKPLVPLKAKNGQNSIPATMLQNAHDEN